MKLSLCTLWGTVATFVGLGMACDNRTGDAPSTTRLTSAEAGATPASIASIDAIALARCDREQRCDNIGDGRKFLNRDACLNDIRAKGDNDLTVSTCPGGVDTARLDACLAAVRTERCDDPLDFVARLSECRTDSLCTTSGKLQGRNLNLR
jgi:hypothetical protein